MSGPDEPQRFATAQLLADLVGKPLDAGYQEAADRRARHGDTGGGHRWYDRPAVAIGCALAGFILVVAYDHTHRDAPQTAKVHTNLVDRVRAAERADSALAKQLQTLNDEVSSVRDKALSSAGALGLNAAAQAAGQTAVKGAGLEVVLREPHVSAPNTSAGRKGSTPITSTNILTDRDVRSVVNQLWADGAQAMSVNNIRLTPASSIRFAGQAILVDFQPLTSPYAIRAIGAPDDLDTSFASSDVASRYQTLVGADGIGFTFSEQQHLSLPASDPSTTRYAVPYHPGSASSSPSGAKR